MVIGSLEVTCLQPEYFNEIYSFFWFPNQLNLSTPCSMACSPQNWFYSHVTSDG